MPNRIGLRIATLLIIATPLTSCLLSATPTASPTLSINVREAGRGYWETVTGRLTLDEYPGKIYYYDWYAIEFTADGHARVTWDDGLNCTRTQARVEGNQIHLNPNDVETTFVIHDATRAAVTFRRGLQVYIKQLQKTRADPQVICN